MTTETLSRPSPVAGVGCRGPESSEADVFRDVGEEDRDAAENRVPTVTTPGGSFVPHLDVALSDFAKGKALEESPVSEQKGNQVEKAFLPPDLPSERIKMADESNQLPRGPEVNDTQDFSSQQLKAEDVLDPLAHEEAGHRSECHGETSDALSQLPHPAATSVSEEKEDRQPPHIPERDMAAPVDPTKEVDVGQEAEGSPPAHQGDASDLSSEPQKPTPNSAPLGLRQESGTVDSHAQMSSVGSGSLEETKVTSSPKEAGSREDSSQATLPAAVAAASPQPACSVLPGTDSPSHPSEEDFCILHSPHASASSSPAGSQGTSPVDSVQEDRESGSSERSTSEETSSSELILLSLASEESPSSLNEHPLRKDSGDHLQANEVLEQVVQPVTPSSPGISGPHAVLDPSCQQRAATGTGCEVAAQPAFTPSPVATDGIFGPAHQGLADGHAWEGQASRKPSGGGGAGEDTKPQVEAGGKAVEESEKGEEDTGTRSPGPDRSKEPEGVKEPPSAKDLPGLESPAGATDPSGSQEPPGAMVLASAEDLHEVRERTGAEDLDSTACPVPAVGHRGSKQTLREGLLLDPGDLAEVPCTTPVADEPSAMDISGYPTEWTEGAADGPQAPSTIPETPIEREIRLHLEREELLRRERGLASPRGTQEYVEVRIRPILNQSGGSSTLPKEKERHWAGVQMQREIQRECQREEDLVQLGKVRGAYDRGTPIELQEKKMLFEQQFNPESLASRRTVCSSSTEGTQGPSFPEANHAANMVVVDSGALRRSQRPQLEKASSANPFFCLRAKSPQSLLEQEVQEARERERELQRQRYSLYGTTLASPSGETTEHEEDAPSQPERPSYKKLEVTWPPPSSSETSQVNGPHQLDRSPRVLRRQRSALIERWESGAVGKQEDED